MPAPDAQTGTALLFDFRICSSARRTRDPLYCRPVQKAGFASEYDETLGSQAGAGGGFPSRSVALADDETGVKARTRHAAPNLFILYIYSLVLRLRGTTPQDLDEQSPRTWQKFGR